MSKEKFHMLPYDGVVTAVDTEKIADTVVQVLSQAGFSGRVGVLHGQAGEDYLDLDGSRHSFFTKLIRQYQRLSGPEHTMIAQAQAVLRHDRYMISIWTDGSEEERVRAFEAVSPYTERTIYFCGRINISILKVGKNYGREVEYEDNL
ncbi:MAG: hypothetical protein AAF614_41670 [Chloroflexota bacterium]